MEPHMIENELFSYLSVIWINHVGFIFLILKWLSATCNCPDHICLDGKNATLQKFKRVQSGHQ